MITGVVNAHHEATIRLPLQAAGGRNQDIEAILDTGFNGSLTLPPADGVPRNVLIEAADTDPLVGMGFALRL